MDFWTHVVQLPVAAGMGVYVVIAVALALSAYLPMRLIVGRHLSEEGQDVAINIFRVSAALLALLLSLTFADVRQTLTKLRDAVELEAAQVADIYNDLQRFGSPEAARLQGVVIAYTDVIIRDEWGQLVNDRLSPEAWRLFDALQTGILDLRADTERRKELRSRLLADIDEVSDHRQARLYHARADPPVFIKIAVVGFLVTMGLLCGYKARPAALAFMSLYAAFVGVVLYFILTMGHPFEGTFRISPTVFEIIHGDFTSGRRT